MGSILFTGPRISTMIFKTPKTGNRKDAPSARTGNFGVFGGSKGQNQAKMAQTSDGANVAFSERIMGTILFTGPHMSTPIYKTPKTKGRKDLFYARTSHFGVLGGSKGQKQAKMAKPQIAQMPHFPSELWAPFCLQDPTYRLRSTKAPRPEIERTHPAHEPATLVFWGVYRTKTPRTHKTKNGARGGAGGRRPEAQPKAHCG